MMTLIEFSLATLVCIIFILLAITPMIAEDSRNVTVRRAEIVHLDRPVITGKPIDQADAA